MSEQQRVILAAVLCLGVLWVWQLMTPPQRQAPPAKQGQREARGPEDVARGTPAVAKPKEAEAEEAPAQPVVAVEEVPETRARFETAAFRGEISSSGSRLTSLELAGYNERTQRDEDAKAVSLVTAELGGEVGQARIGWLLGNRAAPPMRVEEKGGTIELAGEDAQGLRTLVRMTPSKQKYALEYALEIRNATAETLEAGASITMGMKPLKKSGGGFLTPPGDEVSGLCSVGGAIEREAVGGLEDGPWTSQGAAQWAGIDRQYFVVALVPSKNGGTRCSMAAQKSTVVVDFSFEPQALAPGETWKREFSLYVGPKRAASLEAVSPELEDVIDYEIWNIPLGFLARPMVYLLNIFHGWTSSWGIAIFLLTLVVKILLFPVTLKMSLSMRKMQLIRPEIEKIKERFPNDRERQQMEQLKLFREKGINPLGGCLPMLLQMPVWFALYRSLWTAVDLYQQSFLWIPDLTAKEEFPVLALLCGGLMFLQQKMTPMGADNPQAKMMLYVMPVMFTVFMVALPSGLVLYIVINSILTIFQQLAINRTQVKG